MLPAQQPVFTGNEAKCFNGFLRVNPYRFLSGILKRITTNLNQAGHALQKHQVI